MTTEEIAALPPEKPTTRTRVVKIVKWVLAVVLIFFAVRQVLSHWNDVRDYEWHVNWLLIALSIVLHLAAFAMFSQAWCWLMMGFGLKVPLRHGFKIAYIANLGRYIPGRIWPIFGMVYVAKQMKIPEQVAVASWGLALLFGMPPSFMVVALSTWLYPEMLSPELRTYLGWALQIGFAVFFGLSLLLLIAPNKSLALANWTLKLIRRPSIHFGLSLRYAFLVYFGYVVGWVIYGMAFWVFIHAVAANPTIPIFAAVGGFILSYQIGYLAIFTPGGLGARELIMIAVLTPFIGPAAAGIAVAARLWNTISDIIASAIALKLKI